MKSRAFRAIVRRLETEFPLREWFELVKVQVRSFVEYDHAQQKAWLRHGCFIVFSLFFNAVHGFLNRCSSFFPCFSKLLSGSKTCQAEIFRAKMRLILAELSTVAY